MGALELEATLEDELGIADELIAATELELTELLDDISLLDDTTAWVLALYSGWLLTTVGSTSLNGSLNRWLCALVGAYLLWLCSQSTARSGRPTLLLIWFTGTLASVLLNVDLLWSSIWHIVMISVTRSALFYPRPLALLADLALSTIAGLAALWAPLPSSKVLLTLWTFFLLQAGWTLIRSWQTRAGTTPATNPAETHFDSAHATAVAAIRRLSERHL